MGEEKARGAGEHEARGLEGCGPRSIVAEGRASSRARTEGGAEGVNRGVDLGAFRLVVKRALEGAATKMRLAAARGRRGRAMARLARREVDSENRKVRVGVGIA